LKWLEICVPVQSEEDASLVCQLFDLYGQGGAVQEQLFCDQDQGKTTGPPPVTVKTYLSLDGRDDQRLQLLRDKLSDLADLLHNPAVQFRELEEKDWATAWKAFFQPRRIGKRIVLKLPEQTYTAGEGDLVIDLEPGMAFGTGLHATTRMCLVCLEELVRPGDCLLDMGTGSGVLAIAAIKLGATNVLALDNDPTAVAVARENVSGNSVTEAIRVEEGSLDFLTEHHVPHFDGILINIIADVVVDLMERGLSSFLEPKGWLIASGILASAEGTVRATFEKCEMKISARYQEEDWVTLCATKGHSDGPWPLGGEDA
jgi:ribosomal protein L11 methyltransferase